MATSPKKAFLTPCRSLVNDHRQCLETTPKLAQGAIKNGHSFIRLVLYADPLLNTLTSIPSQGWEQGSPHATIQHVLLPRPTERRVTVSHSPRVRLAATSVA